MNKKTAKLLIVASAIACAIAVPAVRVFLANIAYLVITGAYFLVMGSSVVFMCLLLTMLLCKLVSGVLHFLIFTEWLWKD